MTYKDFIKFKIEEYSKEIGASIMETMWISFDNQKISYRDFNIKFFAMIDPNGKHIYNFEYYIGGSYYNKPKYSIEIKYLDYLRSNRINKIETLLNGVQGLHKV
jgi:peptide methionine sulfoxide reductase MsrA